MDRSRSIKPASVARQAQRIMKKGYDAIREQYGLAPVRYEKPQTDAAAKAEAAQKGCSVAKPEQKLLDIRAATDAKKVKQKKKKARKTASDKASDEDETNTDGSEDYTPSQPKKMAKNGVVGKGTTRATPSKRTYKHGAESEGSENSASSYNGRIGKSGLVGKGMTEVTSKRKEREQDVVSNSVSDFDAVFHHADGEMRSDSSRPEAKRAKTQGHLSAVQQHQLPLTNFYQEPMLGLDGLPNTYEQHVRQLRDVAEDARVAQMIARSSPAGYEQDSVFNNPNIKIPALMDDTLRPVVEKGNSPRKVGSIGTGNHMASLFNSARDQRKAVKSASNDRNIASQVDPKGAETLSNLNPALSRNVGLVPSPNLAFLLDDYPGIIDDEDLMGWIVPQDRDPSTGAHKADDDNPMRSSKPPNSVQKEVPEKLESNMHAGALFFEMHFENCEDHGGRTFENLRAAFDYKLQTFGGLRVFIDSSDWFLETLKVMWADTVLFYLTFEDDTEKFLDMLEQAMKRADERHPLNPHLPTDGRGGEHTIFKDDFRPVRAHT